MNARFVRTLEIVTSFHVAVLVALLCLPLLGKVLFWKKPAVIIPVDFTVVVPEGNSSMLDDMNRILSHRDVVAPRDKKPATKPPKNEIKTGRSKLGTPSKNPKDKPLSEAEIRRLLLLGARAGDRNSIPPDEESRCFAFIKRAFNDAWAQPSYDEVGDAVAQIEVRLQKDGSIFGVRLVKKSGNSVLDDSVLQAATSVKRIEGLTSSFLGKYDQVTIDFKVEPQ
jgi:hypothetical protein